MPLPTPPESQTGKVQPRTTGEAPTAADREHAVDLLAQQYALDRLPEADLQARLDRVYRATTMAELTGVLEGIPVDPRAVGEPAQEVRALFSGQEQRMTGAVPRRLELRARFGYVELNLAHATFLPGVTEIDVHSFCGYVEIWLPPGVRVESRGRAVFGYFALKGGQPEGARGDMPLVRITGRALFGYAECHRATDSAPEHPALPPTE